MAAIRQTVYSQTALYHRQLQSATANFVGMTVHKGKRWHFKRDYDTIKGRIMGGEDELPGGGCLEERCVPGVWEELLWMNC